MIRSPAGYGGEVRIKRYLDYYQPSYGAMMLAEGLFGFSTPAGVLLGAETSGMAIDFTSAPISTLVRTASSLSTNYYSGLPFQNEGNGPVTFSRTSNATVTDSNGLIKWAGHNLLTNSESFDAASWSRQGLSGVTANAIAAPNGTTTADKLLETNLNDFHYVAQLNVIDNSAPVSTLSVFAKAAERQYLNLALAWGANFIAATFDLTGGTVTSNRSGGTGASQSSSITSVGGGWYLCTLRGTIGTGGSDAAIIAISDSATPTGAYPQYTGTTGNGFHVWGAHLYRSDLGGMVLNPARGDAYYPTTPPNRLGFTEDFSNAYWTKTGSTVTANAAIAPNGLTTGDLCVEDTSTGAHGINSGSVTLVANTSYTWSVYVKAAGRNWAWINAYDGANRRCWFDLANGVTGTVAAGCTAAITSVGNGWYRLSVIRASGGATGSIAVYAGTADNSTSYTGDGTSGIYLYGAQLSDSASLDAYSPVYGAAVTSAAYYAPRLDYDANGSALGLLVEEQRTNLAWHSADYTQSYWTKVNASIDATAVVAPDGVSRTTLRVKDDATNASHSIRRSFSTTNGLTYTLSFWVKKGTTDTFAAVVYADGVYFATLSVSSVDNNTQSVTGATGVNPTASRVSYPSGWYRYSFTFTATSASAPDINFHPRNLTGAYVGTGDYTDFYGIQLEQGSFATSYIPTGASTATRTADVASVSTQAFPYSSTAGSYVANFQTLFGGTQTLATTILTVDGSGSKLIAYIAGGAQNPGTFDGSTIISVANDVTGSISKIGSSFDASGRSFCANGSTVATGTVAAGYGSGSAVNIGGTLGTGYINGWFRQLTYIPRRLSSSELQARTV